MAGERVRGIGQTRTVYERLRADIVSGVLLPDAKLSIAVWAESLDVSGGAVREALAMLEAEALVVSEMARGYRVAPVSRSELLDLVQARCEVEKLCLAEAIRHGDLQWESEVVAAFHRLSRIAERDPGEPSRLNADWASKHAEFHRALVAACPNRWLKRIHESLYRQSERYRQLAAPLGTVPRDVLGEHQALVNATLNRDVALVQKLMGEHLERTATVLLSSAQLAPAR